MKQNIYSIFALVFLVFFIKVVYAQTDKLEIDTNMVYFNVDQEPQYPGGEEKFEKYISDYTNYPKEAIAKKEMGAVAVSFIIERDGSISHDSAYSLGKATPALVREALRIIQLMPKWNSGVKNDKPVRSEKYLYIKFSLYGDNPANIDTNIIKPSIYIAHIRNAEFPGGEKGRFDFLRENIRMPESLLLKDASGVVYLKFRIRKDGSVTDMVVLKGFTNDCDKEALRILKLMPNWVPGNVDGEPIECWFNMPIRFVSPESIYQPSRNKKKRNKKKKR